MVAYGTELEEFKETCAVKCCGNGTQMGSIDSKKKHNLAVDDTDEIPPTILPLNREVRVHLVPKFYKSEEKGFARTYCLFTTLQEQGEKDLGEGDSTVKRHRDFNARVEFHEQRLGSFSSGHGSSFLDRSDFFSPLSRLRSRSLTIHSTEVEVQKVSVKENDSIRIVGVFKRHLESFDKLTDGDTFELILCPSYKIRSECLDWSLLGTLYTKQANSKHVRHWRAAVRADYT